MKSSFATYFWFTSWSICSAIMSPDGFTLDATFLLHFRHMHACGQLLLWVMKSPSPSDVIQEMIDKVIDQYYIGYIQGRGKSLVQMVLSKRRGSQSYMKESMHKNVLCLTGLILCQGMMTDSLSKHFNWRHFGLQPMTAVERCQSVPLTNFSLDKNYLKWLFSVVHDYFRMGECMVWYYFQTLLQRIVEYSKISVYYLR